MCFSFIHFNQPFSLLPVHFLFPYKESERHVDHSVDIIATMDNQIKYSQEQNRVIALAGLLQSTQQVSLIARNGQWNTHAAITCVHSLFELDANTVLQFNCKAFTILLE